MALGNKKLTRDDAAELYRDLRKTMENMKRSPEKKKSPVDANVAKQIAEAIREGMKKDDALRASGATVGALGDELTLEPRKRDLKKTASKAANRFIGDVFTKKVRPSSGKQTAIMVVAFILLSKVTMSALEVTGVFEIENAQASLTRNTVAMRPFSTPGQYTAEEVTVLKALDSKRLELEGREKKLVKMESDFELQEQEFVARLSEVRELTEKLKDQRNQNETKRNSQLEQLSNVYGSMNPKEAAQLIEQLDVTISLKLLERMPEKRIGQILSLMSPERALTITRMLSR